MTLTSHQSTEAQPVYRSGQKSLLSLTSLFANIDASSGGSQRGCQSIIFPIKTPPSKKRIGPILPGNQRQNSFRVATLHTKTFQWQFHVQKRHRSTPRIFLLSGFAISGARLPCLIISIEIKIQEGKKGNSLTHQVSFCKQVNLGHDL